MQRFAAGEKLGFGFSPGLLYRSIDQRLIMALLSVLLLGNLGCVNALIPESTRHIKPFIACLPTRKEPNPYSAIHLNCFSCSL